MGSTGNGDDVVNPMAGVLFRLAGPENHDDILALLYRNFYLDEPLHCCLDLTDGVRRNLELEEFAYASLKKNMTIMAIDQQTGKILGVCINTIAVKGENVPLEVAMEKYKDSNFRYIIQMLHYVNTQAGDLFAELGSDILFDIKILSTDKESRRRGLGTDLVRRSVELAKCLGFGGVKAEASSAYSRKAFLNAGFEIRSEYRYTDFEDENGKKIFIQSSDPHIGTNALIRRFND